MAEGISDLVREIISTDLDPVTFNAEVGTAATWTGDAANSPAPCTFPESGTNIQITWTGNWDILSTANHGTATRIRVKRSGGTDTKIFALVTSVTFNTNYTLRIVSPITFGLTGT